MEKEKINSNNQKNFENVSLKETTFFEIGDFLKDSKQRIGEIIGIETISGEKTLKVEFAEYIGYFPLSRISNDIEVIKKQNLSIPEEKTTQEFLEEQNIKIKEKIKRETLQKYIEGYKFKMEELGLLFDEKIEKKLRKIFEEVILKNYVFRGDGRHPFAKSEFDQSENIQKGIFEIGFVTEGGKYGNCVYLTADIHRAISYPYDDDMPADWDRQKFIYFIDSEIVFQKILSLDLKDLDENEIRTSHIHPNFIKYAIQIDDTANKIVKIFYNKQKIKNK